MDSTLLITQMWLALLPSHC